MAPLKNILNFSEVLSTGLTDETLDMSIIDTDFNNAPPQNDSFDEKE